MSSSFLTAHQSQASSAMNSWMFHPKVRAGWKIKTGKPFISSPVRSHFPFQKKEHQSFQRLLHQGWAQGCKVKQRCAPTPPAMRGAPRESSMSLQVDSTNPFKMANGELQEDNGDRKPCRLIFLFFHTCIYRVTTRPFSFCKKSAAVMHSWLFFLALLPV